MTIDKMDTSMPSPADVFGSGDHQPTRDQLYLGAWISTAELPAGELQVGQVGPMERRYLRCLNKNHWPVKIPSNSWDIPSGNG